MISSIQRSRLRTAISVLLIFLIVLLFQESETAAENLRRGLKLCFETLIPSIFPFMVISDLLVRSGACGSIPRPIRHAFERLFGVSGACAPALLLGIFCGFPVGAKTAISLYSNGYISKRDCEHILSFCNLPSPPFIIFAVGEGMFGSNRIGIFLYCTLLASGLLYGVLMRPKKNKVTTFKPAATLSETENIFSAFSASVVSGANSVISVCAFVTFFTCIVGTFSSVFGTECNSPLQALLFSFFELTSGCSACTSLDNTNLSLIIAAAAGGWSGLSVFFQISSLVRTESKEISLLPYVKVKALSALLSSAIAAVFTHFCPSLTKGINTAEDAFSSAPLRPRIFTLTVNIIFIFVSLICLYKLLDRRRKI